jgi:site-specific recombinase XerD
MKTDFSYQLSRYFTTYLAHQRGLSSHTISSYRDTFSKLLQFFREQGVEPERLTFPLITREKVEDFLIWLDVSQGCGIATRNHRLAGIKAFMKYVQGVCPDYLDQCSRIIRGIRVMKSPKPVIRYLSKNGIALLLAQPDTSTPDGRRDLAMLSLLYDAGARVQELCDLTVQDLRLSSPSTVKLTGKGNKSRFIPLSKPNVDILRKYLKERGLDSPTRMYDPVFTNRQNCKLTRGGVSYLLAKYVSQANAATPNSIPENITPHCLRHSKAMHLLESGSNLIYIRDFLGHENLETTLMYAKANPEVKRAALEKVYAAPDTPQIPDWNDDLSLVGYLKGLGR